MQLAGSAASPGFRHWLLYLLPKISQAWQDKNDMKRERGSLASVKGAEFYRLAPRRLFDDALHRFAVAAFHIRTSCFAALLLNRQCVNWREIAEIISNRSGRLAQ